MPRRLTLKNIDEIRLLYDEGKGLNAREIAERTGFHPETIAKNIRAWKTTNPDTGKPFKSAAEREKYLIKNRINPDTGKPYRSSGEYNRCLINNRINPDTGKPYKSKREYEERIALMRRNPQTGNKFTSSVDYQKHLVENMINPDTGKPYKSGSEYNKYRIEHRINPDTEKPFKSPGEYQDFMARQRVNPETNEHFTSHNEYLDYMVRQKTNPDTGRPFESKMEYENHIRKKNLNKPENKEFRILMEWRLKSLGKSRNGLAREVGLSSGTVSEYASGKKIPRGKNLKKILQALGLPPDFPVKSNIYNGTSPDEGIVILKKAIRERIRQNRIKPGETLENIVIASDHIKSLTSSGGAIRFYQYGKEYGYAFLQEVFKDQKDEVRGYVFNFYTGPDVTTLPEDTEVMTKLETDEVSEDDSDLKEIKEVLKSFSEKNGNAVPSSEKTSSPEDLLRVMEEDWELDGEAW